MTLATLSEVKSHLRVTHSDEDALIAVYIDAAEDYIGQYLNNSNFPNAPSIKAALLLTVGDLYENREGAGEKEIVENPAVIRLLTPYRERMGI